MRPRSSHPSLGIRAADKYGITYKLFVGNCPFLRGVQFVANFTLPRFVGAKSINLQSNTPNQTALQNLYGMTYINHIGVYRNADANGKRD